MERYNGYNSLAYCKNLYYRRARVSDVWHGISKEFQKIMSSKLSALTDGNANSLMLRSSESTPHSIDC